MGNPNNLRAYLVHCIDQKLDVELLVKPYSTIHSNRDNDFYIMRNDDDLIMKCTCDDIGKDNDIYVRSVQIRNFVGSGLSVEKEVGKTLMVARPFANYDSSSIDIDDLIDIAKLKEF